MDASATASRYQTLAPLGHGGMGQVFSARDTKLGREVALKRLHASLLSDAAAVDRFLREGRAAAALSHPAVVHVYDVDLDQEGPFIAMELVKGPSLAERLQSQGPLALRAAVALGVAVGEALVAIHQQGLVHRDVKPSNILLDAQGSPHLTDFGLALSEGRGELTRSLLGTPEFMAPEQGRTPVKVDIRTDVFGLAATLYAALTGDSPRLIRESLIPEPVRPLLLRALSEYPEARPPTMRTFVDELAAAGRPRRQRAKLLFALKLLGAVGAVASAGSVIYGAVATRARTTVERPAALQEAPSVPDDSKPPEPVAGTVAPEPRLKASFTEVQIAKTVIESGYALGFVVNEGEAPLSRPRITVRLFDEKGSLLQTASGYAASERLDPGQRFPAAILLDPWRPFARWEAEVEASPPFGTLPAFAKVTILEQRLEKAQYSGYDVFAKVRNDGDRPTEYAELVAALFDGQGRLISVATAYLPDHSLAPGKESAVTVHAIPLGTEAPARYELYLAAMAD